MASTTTTTTNNTTTTAITLLAPIGAKVELALGGRFLRGEVVGHHGLLPVVALRGVRTIWSRPLALLREGVKSDPEVAARAKARAAANRAARAARNRELAKGGKK